MEELEKNISDICDQTISLKPEHMQMILIYVKKYNKSLESHNGLWIKISALLWDHIEKGFSKIDEQLLCATCLFTIITHVDNENEYLLKTKKVIETELCLRSKNIEKGLNSLQTSSLMYGMFQSSYLAQNLDDSLIGPILNSAFSLLIMIGYEYSQYTFIAFKTIASFKKVYRIKLLILTPENQMTLLNFINHNWENPITGVRDLNREIFQTLLTVCDKCFYKSIIENINSFYWNKAKFLMISELIEYSGEDIKKLLIENDWVDGLVNSLNKPGLVSAGADMYYAAIKKIRTDHDWCNIFLDKITALLKEASSTAVENFYNYWCQTTLKAFPSLMNIILTKLNPKFNLYSVIFLMKQGNKLGILTKNWNTLEENTFNGNFIEDVLVHHNSYIRMLAFDIICQSHGKSMPSNVEYTLVLDYLKDNINSDCTVLRLNLLSSLNIFLSKIHILFKNMKDDCEIDGLVEFSKKLQSFIIWSLNLDGNYQRKIATVKVLNTIICCFGEIPKKKKQQTREGGITLMEFLINKKFWILHDQPFVDKLFTLLKDPSDDIRENVLKVFLNHHTNIFIDAKDNANYNNLVEDAFQCRKSKFFYEINCGQAMFKLIVNLLLKKEHRSTVFKCVADVFNYAFDELLIEYNSKKDVLKSIEHGTQLHSYISILQVVLEACIINSYKLNIPTDCINKLIEVLQGVTNQFICEQDSTSSDFSKMNQMIEGIIAKSGYSYDEKDDAKISGLHQIVLNCLWLNVKASCDLAALLIHYRSEDVTNGQNCLSIITHVLETSRHKGAIEAAGTALGKAIQHLTTLPEDSIGAKLPQTLLQAKLSQLISEASKMASITRRGAGLTIMVHKIVSSDMRKSKPLFHYFMKTLLETFENVPNKEHVTNIENYVDLPKAILIHFLTKIVTDSSLASDIMFYSADLAEMAFSNLTSPHWQIRNAALQLYGALIPRLIGQKKASGTDAETIATVACDELRTHSPKLWIFIIEQLKHQNYTDKINAHSNLVPILNLLASCAKRYNFSYDLKVQASSDYEILNYLINVLDSPLHTVRRLTAKCIFNIFSFEDIQGFLENNNCISENLLHGSLLLLKLSFQYYNSQSLYQGQINSLIKQYRDILKCKKHSYWSLEVLESIQSSNQDVKAILEKTTKNNEPGLFLWVNTSIKNGILNSDWENIPYIIVTLLQCNERELLFDFLLEKIENDLNIPDQVLSKISNILLTFDDKYNSCIVWKILYIISMRIEINVDATEIVRQLKIRQTYKLRYIIPFVSRLFLKLREEEQQILQNVIYKLCNFENFDTDMRYIAVLANNEIASVFYKVSDSIKETSIKSAILLLQDEDVDIRNVSIYYYKNLKHLNDAVHPYICLNRILDYKFLAALFSDPKYSISKICDDIVSLLSTNIHNSNDTYNPFANDAKNIYIEVVVLKQSLLSIKEDSNS